AYMYGSIGTISGYRIIDGLVRDRDYYYEDGSYKEHFLLNNMDRTLKNRSECLKDQIDSYQLHGEN
ncbi:endothelin-converting enzyme 2, partial [Biomphalaria pfeifferi]